jgi:hypothetical protein
MGVTCVFYGISDEEIGTLLQSPASIHAFLRNAIPVEAPGCIGSFLGKKPRTLQPTRPYFDLGKSWGAVNFVFTGTGNEIPLPQGFITSGGSYVGNEDVGYGPARVLDSNEVGQVAAMLEALDVDSFRARVDAKRMRTLHLSGAPPSDDLVLAQYLFNDYYRLREFMLERARLGEGVVIQFV